MSKHNTDLNPWIVACVVALCIAGVALILTLPSESLMIDLVYQAF